MGRSLKILDSTPAHVCNTEEFPAAFQFEAVVELNVVRLHSNGQPIAKIEAVYRGPNASKASPDNAAGLEPMVCLDHDARVMLTNNFWFDVGLVNGTVGIVLAICYREGTALPTPLVAVTVKFDSYYSPTLSDRTVSITSWSQMWSYACVPCLRHQFPLRHDWAESPFTRHRVPL